MAKTKDIEIEKMELTSMDIVEDKKQMLKRFFPEVFTEKKIDFDRLRAVLGDDIETGKERYGLNWSGKADCLKIIQRPSIGTLKPCVEESVDFENTENLFIEGDNLEVLKLLQKSYYGKVKMIYIDPPYNTGNDFIYPDNYSESLDTYLQYTGQTDEQGRKFSTNPETDGRFHTKWINMMYPRLYLARNLLKDDGVIFVSIDDNEVSNLRKMMDEIFGEENFVTSIIWFRKVSPSNDATWFSSDHDHILVYAKNKDIWRPIRLPMNERQKSYYTNPDSDQRGPWNSATYTCNKTKEQRPNLFYPLTNPNTGNEVWPKKTAVWAYSKELYIQHTSQNLIYWGKDGKSNIPRLKKFLSEAGSVVPRTVWLYKEVGSTQTATQELREMIPAIRFDTPKPSSLIINMIRIVTTPDEGDVVLDFFSGSATTAHAVLHLNKEDGGNRKFIMVQLPEPTDNPDFPTIADIGKERIRRVIDKIKTENESSLNFEDKKPDLGFKVFKLDKSNFKVWDGDNPDSVDLLMDRIEGFIDHINPKSSQEDILFELLLKSGFELTTGIEKINLAGKDVFSVSEDSLLICLDKDISKEVLLAMAEKKPPMVICLDAGFQGNDQLKTNTVQIMKSKEIEFRTV